LRFAVDVKLSVRNIIKIRGKYKKKERLLKHTREKGPARNGIITAPWNARRWVRGTQGSGNRGP
jgi:hypothetical protein